MTQENIPFSEIVSEISRLSKQKASGTFCVTTSTNRSAQIALDKGEIVFVFYSGKLGSEAISLMAKIPAGRFKFQEGGAATRRMDLPSAANIIEILRKGSNDTHQKLPAAQEQEKKPAVNGNTLKPEQKSILQSCLADCIGPMAAIICEDHFQAAATLQEAVDALAAEIPSSSQAAKFRQMVEEKLF